MHKTMQESLEALVHRLYLTIYLWVLRGVHPQLSTRELEQCLPELTYKNRISFIDK
jgi:hypothetical protein